jgi:lipopolysaccharide biosynthesis regulator YciM
VGWWTRAFGGDARAPRDVDSALRKALLAALDRDLERAERMLRHAVRLDADAIEPFQALGRLFRMRGEIGRAIRIHQNLLLRADRATEEGVELVAELAADFRQGGFLRRAIASYEEVLARDPRHREALRALAALLAEVREFPRAIAMERRLARVEGRDAAPGEAKLRVEMARAAWAEGRSEEALRAVKKALRKDAGSVDAWIVLGELEAERGRTRAALAAWKRVPHLDRRAGPRVYPQLAATYAALGRTRDYEKLLRELLDARPDDAAARLALARDLAGRGDVDEAIGELQRELARHPDDLEARGTLGRLLLSERRDLEAAKEYGELLAVLERQGWTRPREPLE